MTRTGGTFNVTGAPPSSTSSSSSSYSSMAPLHSSLQHSPWHSPVPYLFGGLAAMLGLIAFALLILACSYWKLSGNLDNREDENERDTENGDAKTGEVIKVQTVYEEKIVVIMAGDEKPRFLATPAISRNSFFGDSNGTKSNPKEVLDGEKLEKIEKPKQEESSTDHEQQEVAPVELNSQNPRNEANSEQS